MISFPQLGKLGRLGNQMFQIASTIGIAKRSEQLAIFPEWQYQKFFKNELPTAKILIKDIVQESTCDYQNTSMPEHVRPIGLHGYFQSYKYFEKYKEDIFYYFEFSEEIEDYIKSKYSEELNSCDTFMHVRRGDYEKLSNVYYLQSSDYFSECAKLAESKKIAVFSDDIEWCKENFKNLDCLFVSERNHSKGLDTQDSEEESKSFLREDVVEFALMTKFQNSIISNSSYSWWSAYLNKDKNKKIFAPKNWYKEEHIKVIYPIKEDYNYREDLIPKSWTLV